MSDTNTIDAELAGGAVIAPPTGPKTDSKPAESRESAEVRLTSDALKARLEEERAAARTRFLKELGFEKPDDVKSALAKAKALEESQLTEQQRVAKALEELTPKAKRADTLSATLAKYLAAEEAAIPESKRGLLDLAPPADNPDARLEWITTAKAKGLFADTAAAQGAAAASQAAKPATTVAQAGPATPKAPGTLTPYEQYQQLKATQPLRAAAFFQMHRAAIAASTPK